MMQIKFIITPLPHLILLIVQIVSALDFISLLFLSSSLVPLNGVALYCESIHVVLWLSMTWIYS